MTSMDPALWELLEGGHPEEEVAAVIRLRGTGAVPRGVRIVTQFGDIATCRLRRADILEVRADENVGSMKGPRLFAPEHDLDLPGPAVDFGEAARETDERRPPDESAEGRGVVVGVIDWGVDFAHPDFLNDDGTTRLLALWDQRAHPAARANSYGYGRIHSAEAINRSLASRSPYAALGYHPADADLDRGGTHGTHVLGIAAGNGRAGGPAGVAPSADCVFVHLSMWGGEDQARLGDSVTVIEAIDFIARTAGTRPWVVNMSLGRHAGPHDGSTLVEQALDAALMAAPGRAIVQSAGNYFDRRAHAAGQLRPGESRTLVWKTDEADSTPNEMDIWYPGQDHISVEVRAPDGTRSQRIGLGERDSLSVGGREVCKIYNRAEDPNNRHNHIDIFLYSGGPAGEWEVTLGGEDIVDGRFHAWIERDAACRNCQTQFESADAVTSTTTGTICNGFRTVAVGAYNSHAPEFEMAPFSSGGPTRDGRIKPDLVAPGVGILSARSSPRRRHAEESMLARKSGTSMAAPHVAGTIALMHEVARRPLRIKETRKLLLTATRSVPASAELVLRVGSGVLDTGRAVDLTRRFFEERREPRAAPRRAGEARSVVREVRAGAVASAGPRAEATAAGGLAAHGLADARAAEALREVAGLLPGDPRCAFIRPGDVIGAASQISSARAAAAEAIEANETVIESFETRGVNVMSSERDDEHAGCACKQAGEGSARADFAGDEFADDEFAGDDFFDEGDFADDYDAGEDDFAEAKKKRNFILLSGGPGPFDDRDIEHDASWANYVTPPLLQGWDGSSKKVTPFWEKDEEVWWFVYKPAYETRWTEDSKSKHTARKLAVQAVKDKGFKSYAHMIEGRAKRQGWKLRWLTTADDFWKKLATFNDPVSRVWYWGHARNDLWLSVAHDPANGEAVAPSWDAIIEVSDIDAKLKKRFQKGHSDRIHRFVGCNTTAFAEAWAKAYDVWAEGVEDKVSFISLSKTGGEPCLVKTARVVNFEPGGGVSAKALSSPYQTCKALGLGEVLEAPDAEDDTPQPRRYIPASEMERLYPLKGASEALSKFRSMVYEAHVKRSLASGKKFIENVPESELGQVEGVKMHVSAAGPLQELLNAARLEIRTQGKDIKVKAGSGHRSTAGQFKSWATVRFMQYYRQATEELDEKTGRSVLEPDDFSQAAADKLAGYIAKRYGAPGFSNHQHGLAVDFNATEVIDGKTRRLWQVFQPGHKRLWWKSWFWHWLEKEKNAYKFGFVPYVDEPWHWEYRPEKARQAVAGESEAEKVEQQTRRAPAIPTLIKREDDVPAYTLYVAIKLGEESPARPMTGIFIPQNYQSEQEVDLIVYLHGQKKAPLGRGKSCECEDGFVDKHNYCWCPKLTIDEYWTPKYFPYFPLREGLNESGRNFVLVAPTLNLRPSGAALSRPGGFDDYVKKVLAALHAYGPHKEQRQAPEVGRIIIAAHSAGGSLMRRIMKRADPTSSQVVECWGFDCLYGGTEESDFWIEWGRKNQDKKLFVHYKGTRGSSGYLRKEAGSDNVKNVIVDQRESKGNHFQVPIEYWRRRIDEAFGETRTTETDEANYFEAEDFEAAEFGTECGAVSEYGSVSEAEAESEATEQPVYFAPGEAAEVEYAEDEYAEAESDEAEYAGAESDADYSPGFEIPAPGFAELADAAVASGVGATSASAVLGEMLSVTGQSSALDPLGRGGALSPAVIFDALAPGGRPALRRQFEPIFEVLAAPGGFLGEQLRPGDLLVRRGEMGLGHLAVVAAPGLWPQDQLTSAGLRPEGLREGLYAQVIEGGAFPHASADGFARLFVEGTGRVPRSQMVLRLRHAPPGAAGWEGDEGDEAWGDGSASWAEQVNRKSPEYTRWVQSSLNQVNNAGLVVDGISGSKTRAAVMNFQRQHGLVADGVVGPKTEAALIEAGAPLPPGMTPPLMPVPPGPAPPTPNAPAFPPSAVIDERIDVDAQFSLQRMSRGDASARADAVGMLRAIKETGELAGIYGDNLKKAAELAARHGTVRWELVPKGEDAALVLEPGDTTGALPPTIIFRGGDPPKHHGIRKQPARLDAALRKAWATFLLLKGGKLGACELPRPDVPALFGAAAENQPLACPSLNNLFPPVLPDIPVPVIPQVIPPLTPVPATPKGLMLVPHAHVPRTCKDGKSFISAPTATAMSPATMNPGFLKADDLIEFDLGLDAKLVKLLLDTPKYAVMLSEESKKKRQPSPGDKIRVALVDLTGDKLCKPGFAGWGSTTPITGGSTVKIAMVYAAHQLLFDLNEMARLGSISTAAALKKEADSTWAALKCAPDYDWLVEFDESGATVKASASENLKTHLRETVDASFSNVSTTRASELIVRLGFEYIASVLWQCGLRHPTRRGLWIRNTFQGASVNQSKNRKCYGGAGGMIVWAGNPFTGEAQNSLTALAATTFFTLLAQQRLVNVTASSAMQSLLSRGCSFMPSLPGVTVRATKCGLTSAVKHDAALLEASDRRYALAVLTTNPAWPARADFIRDLDGLINDNNP